MEEEETNIFKQMETLEQLPESAKKAVMAELELLQNSTQVLEHFATNYFNTLGLLFNND
jgi:hypothetical protein